MGEMIVWSEPIERGDLRLVAGDISEALIWFKNKTGQDPKLIMLNANNEHLAGEASDGIKVAYSGGILRGEVWLSSDNTFIPKKQNPNKPYWCEVCLLDKDEVSPDPRYCPDCYEFLLKEAEMLSPTSRPRWIPRASTTSKSGVEKPIDKEMYADKEKTKMSTLNSTSPTVDNFRPRGRPTSYKKRQLPIGEIQQLNKEGEGPKAISTRLKKKGIIVHYKTVQRVLSGERKEG